MKNRVNRALKKQVLSILFATLVAGFFGGLLISSTARAEALEYSYDLTRDNPNALHCTILANGEIPIVPVHINPGDSVLMHFTNQTENTFDLYSIKMEDFLNGQSYSPSPVGDWSYSEYESYGPHKSTVSLDAIDQDVFILGEFGSPETNGCSGVVGLIRIYTDGRPAAPEEPSAPETSENKPAKKPSPAQASASPTPPGNEIAATALEPPKLTGVTVNGELVTNYDSLVFNQSNPVLLTGNAAPNSTIRLTIHSTPKTEDVLVDAQGNWSFAVTGLEPGEHYIEASTVDPVSGQASDPVRIFQFVVQPSSAVMHSPARKRDRSQDVTRASAIILSFIGLGYVLNREMHITQRLKMRPRLKAKK